MNTKLPAILTTCLALVSVGFGQTSQPAATASAPETAAPEAATLPSGHPDIGAMGGAMGGGAGGAMPPGHPDLDAMGGMGGAGGGALPSGHPAIGGKARSAARPVSVKGSLTINLTQGSKGGPAIAGEKVGVEFYARDVLLDRREGTADEKGNLVFSDLTLSVPVQAVISVTHAGVLQQGASSLSPEAPNQTVTMSLFEATADAPAWTIPMRHLILHPADDGVHVIEMISASNPSDRVWVGKNNVTFSMPLPEGATDVKFGENMDEKNTRIDNGQFVTGVPMYPGPNEFSFGYRVPLPKSGKLHIAVGTPAPIGEIKAFIPDDPTQITPTGLEFAGTKSMGKEQPPMRMYRAGNIAAGQALGLTLAPASAVRPGLASPKNIALAGGLLLSLAGMGFLMLRKPKASDAKK